MPTNADFEKAAIYILDLTQVAQDVGLTKFLKINYKGDVARIHADGQLVEDNFWNGKPMLVRLSDLIGKQVELRIQPLSKNYPIYFQAPQRAEIEKAPNGILLSLDSIELLTRTTVPLNE